MPRPFDPNLEPTYIKVSVGVGYEIYNYLLFRSKRERIPMTNIIRDLIRKEM